MPNSLGSRRTRLGGSPLIASANRRSSSEFFRAASQCFRHSRVSSLSCTSKPRDRSSSSFGGLNLNEMARQNCRTKLGGLAGGTANRGLARYSVQKEWPLQRTATLVSENCFWTAYFFRKRRAMPSAPRAAPSNMTVVPPSGVVAVIAPNTNLVPSCVTVKVKLAGVESNPLPLIVPTPVTLRKLKFE